MLLEGAVLGRYQLVRQIGSGGMGTVFFAQDQQNSHQVAIKVVRIDDEMSNRNAARRMEQLFLREVQAISHLEHPHILPISDSGQTTLAGATYSFMVMPYCQEGSLANWLLQHEEEVLPHQAAKLVVQAAEALQYAHERGVIHQDVKPSNFLLRPQSAQPAALPDLLLSDFGIARFFTATSSTNHDVRGTPFFMAPEQWDGHAVPASDQYALAIMAFHLLTGRYPFEGSPAQLMRQHYMTQPPTPSSLHPQMNQMVDGVLLRALAKEPERRMPSIIEFAQALEQACQLSDQTDLSLAEVAKQVRLDPPVVAPTIPTVLAAPASLSEPQAIFAHQKTDPQTPPGSAKPPTPDRLRVDQPVPLGWRPAAWQKMALASLAVLLIFGGGALLLFNNLTHASGQKGPVIVTYTTSNGTVVTIIETAPSTRGNTPGNSPPSASGTTPSASGTTPSASGPTPAPGTTPKPGTTPTPTPQPGTTPTPTPKPSCSTHAWTATMVASGGTGHFAGGIGITTSGNCSGKIELEITASVPTTIQLQVCYGLDTTNCSLKYSFSRVNVLVVVATGIAKGKTFYINGFCSSTSSSFTVKGNALF